MQDRLHQDSEVSFIEDTDEDMSTTEIEDDWIEYLKRSTSLADEKMKTRNTFCWITTHKTMKWIRFRC